MFCNSNNASKESQKRQAVGVSWPDDAKAQDKEGNTVMNPEDADVRKNEKRKLQQDLKAVEAEKRAVAKEMKKLTAERNSFLNKRKAYIRSKDENNKLQEKIENQKKIWVNQQSRKSDIDGPRFLEEVSDLVSRLVEVQEEANKEWDKIKKIRGNLKEQNSKIKQSKKQLDAEWTKLKEDRITFEKDTNECNNRVKDTYKEQERLKNMRAEIETRNSQVENQSKRDEQLNLILKDRVRLITEQEIIAREKDEELKKENAIVDDLKKNVYFSLEQRRAAFNEKFSRLTAEYLKYASTYSQVIEDNELEAQCITAIKKVEAGIKDTQIQKPEVFQVAEDVKEQNSEVKLDQDIIESGSVVTGNSTQIQTASQGTKLEQDISDKGDSQAAEENGNVGELDFMAALEAEVAKKLYPEQKIQENTDIYRELTPSKEIKDETKAQELGEDI